MNLKTGIGKTGVALAVVTAIAMCVLSLIFHPLSIEPVQYGLCLPSPDSWDFNPFWSWIINVGIIGITALLIYLINKSYNFIRTTEPAYVVLFMMMTCSGPWFTEGLNTSVLLALANVVSIGIIFGSYESRNATREMFILGVVVGIGSMFQYAFLPMAIVYVLLAVFMKVLRIKESLALVVGFLCPYWITLGIGWLHFSDFHFPSITPLFGLSWDYSEVFLLLAGIAVAAGLGIMVTLVNSIKLYAGNSRVNAMNLCVTTLGGAALLCLLVDFDNMPAYVVTLYLTCALQTGNICALWNPKMPWMVTVLPSLPFLAIFVCSIVFKGF